MSDSQASNVPKFGSFRPRPVPAPRKDEPQTKEKTEKRHTSNKHEQSRRKERHERIRSRSRERDNSNARVDSIQSRVHVQEGLPDLFFIDRKGDEKNLIYGSIHKYSIPAFRRFGAGYVVGLSSDFRIEQDHGDDKGITILNRNESKLKSREKYIFSKAGKPRLLKIRAEITGDDGLKSGADFVSLTRGKKRKRGIGTSNSPSYRGTRGVELQREFLEPAHNSKGHVSEEPEANPGSEADERDYRSIYGKKSTKDLPSDDEVQYATESESSGSDAGYAYKVDPTIQQKNIALSRKVEQSPHDVEAWLALIDYQDIVLRAGDERHRTTNAEIKSTAEIKIHMYEKAIEKAQSLENRERLLLGLMAEGAKIWESKAQSERWEQISNDNIDSLLLWTSYLNFKQSNFPTFRYEEIKLVYLSRIKLLTRAINNADPTPADQIYHQLVYVLLRLTLFIRESGYSELAIAIWQGILEVNFFGPKQQMTRDDTINLFKEFWESEVLRIGEDGALGWQRYVENEASSMVPGSIVDAEDNSLDNENIFKSWCKAERIRSECTLPARTMDEVVEDDPFRVIIFSDIEDFLPCLPSGAEKLRTLCIDAYLLFCGLPIMSTGITEPRKWSQDAFVRNELLQRDISSMERLPKAQIEDESAETNCQSNLKLDFSNYPRSPDTMFSSNRWFHDSSLVERYSQYNGPVPYKWVQTVLKQLAQSHRSEELAEYFLGFQSINEPETIKKIAKSILKQYPSNLRLYNAYAMIEWSRNKDIAKGVFTAALNMRYGTNGVSSNDTILLWKSWIWCCLGDGDKDSRNSALDLLLSISDGKSDPTSQISPTLLLKTKQHLSSNQSFLLSSGDYDQAIIYIECLALLEYLTSTSTSEPQGNITSALEIFINFSQDLKSRLSSGSSAQELLLQSSTRLLHHHSINGPHRPAQIRSHLLYCISLFPSNTVFLSLLAYNERRLRVENVVRNTLSRTVLTPKHDCVTSRHFAITHELKYGTIHSVRAAFEHALSSPACKSSTGLWRFYIVWISGIEKFMREGKGKEAWFRALRACPWSKELFVVGFEGMGGSASASGNGLGFKELRSTWRVMGEKELRIHVDLEERFEEIGERKGDSGLLRSR